MAAKKKAVEASGSSSAAVEKVTQKLASIPLTAMTQFTPDMPLTVEGIAQVAHEANRALCMAMGDHSQVPWSQAPQWQKDSAVQGVMGVLKGEITSPEQSHESWMKQKKAEGWKHGKVKDPITKTHPAMLAFPHLPIPQQIKDYVFQAVVSGILGFLAQKYPNIAPFIGGSGTQSNTNPAQG